MANPAYGGGVVATVTQTPSARRKRGRPRDPRVEDAALSAARTLLLEKGMTGCTIAAVATAANVGKGTIYLRWPDKESLIVDALRGLDTGQFDFPETGSTKGDLLLLAEAAAEFMSSEAGALLAATLGELPRYPRLQAMYEERVLVHWVELVGRILAKGQKRGEVRKGVDPEKFTDMMFGPMVSRRIVRSGALPPDFARKITETLLEGIAPRKK